MFCRWPHELPRQVEVCPIQLPGREERLGEPPINRLESLLDALLPALRPYLDRPFAFFGHSMGAKIGFELTRRLCKDGGPTPLHLFVSGSRAPQLPDKSPPIYHLPEDEFVAELRRFNGTPEAVLCDAELMQLFLPLLRADLALNETYVYTSQEPLDCSISAFGGLADEEVSRDDLAAWREQTRGSFSLRIFHGGHFFLRGARSQLLQAIFQDLLPVLGRIGRVAQS